MYYIWTITDKYPQSYWLKYDWRNNPEHLQFLGNKKINQPNSNIIFRLDKKVNQNSFLKFDYVMSDAVPLVSEKLASIILDNNPEDVELIQIDVYQENNYIRRYYIPIFLQVVSCIDKNKSIFDKEIDDYTTIVFKPKSLGDKTIVKAKGYEDGNPIVQENFVYLCNQAGIKGIHFYKEPFINPLYSET